MKKKYEEKNEWVLPYSLHFGHMLYLYFLENKYKQLII